MLGRWGGGWRVSGTARKGSMSPTAREGSNSSRSALVVAIVATATLLALAAAARWAPRCAAVRAGAASP